MSLQDLKPADRLKLMRFVCSFAWADLEIADSERQFVHDLVAQLELNTDEKQQVEQWLKHPPRAEELDPQDIPVEHRQVFLNQALAMVAADGNIDEDEVENFALFEKLLGRSRGQNQNPYVPSCGASSCAPVL